MSYELDTVVRRPVSRARVLAALGAMGGAFAFLPRTAVLILACLATAILSAEAFATFGSRRARVVASREGLRIGARFVPRDAFGNALLAHEDGRTYVALRGRVNLDVQVPNNIEADALVRALGLDAASSTVEVALTHSPSPLDWALIALAIAMMLFGLSILLTGVGKVLGACGVALLGGTFWVATRVTLRIGADGLVLRRPLGREQFIAHDAITHVASDGDAIVLTLSGGARLVLRVGGFPAGSENAERQRAREERRADEALAVVRRIQQAQRAFHEHAAAADSLAAVLDRGKRSAREWLDQLRRIGEGAQSAFRTIGVARAQLFEIVESTTASSHDRIAAAIALRARLADDEKPRVRVAAERCVEPALRERMLRVLEAEDDAELETLIDEKSGSRR